MINKNFVDQCLKEALLMQGQLIALQDEKIDIVKKVKEANLWLGKQPDFLNFLQHLQNILHQKNIGAFSELLSYFVKDVLKKDKDIVLDLYTYHNLPALRIEASNKGQLENIIEGNGGSIANIVSTGLRLIALSRLGHRKFIVLDEPDCWLKPEHVPIFAKIIGEISAQLKIQTIIISHHHWKYFKDYGRVIELKQDGPHLTTEIIHDTEDNTDPTKRDIIEKVVLSRFMSHYDTVFELHPNLTCIVGENDIGKSVLATALKALSYADSSDSYIMHHEKEAKVMIELTGERQILWQRFLKTDQDNTQKVKYSLYIKKVLVQSEYSSNETPNFIQNELNICTTEDIDVHIGNQKQPVFLLSSDTKPQQRAKILSLGKESLMIQKMMENIKAKTKQYKYTVKDGETRYASVEKQLAVLENIDDIVQRMEKLKDDIFILEKQEYATQELSQFITQLDELEGIASTEKINHHSINVPHLHSTSELESFLIEYELTSKLAEQEPILKIVAPISLHPVQHLEELIQETIQVEKLAQIEPIIFTQPDIALISTAEIERAIELISLWEKMGQLITIDYDIQKPELYPYEELEKYLLEVEEQEKLEEELLNKHTHLEKWKEKLAQERKLYLAEYGSECPTCKQPVTEEHLKGAHHA